jgi:stage II sporulation protein D
MRQLPVLTGLVVALALAGAAAAALRPTPDANGAAGDATPAEGSSAPAFVLTGSGWGHGAGMSQWGAYAQARAGRSAADILAFYYPGTVQQKVPATTVRVLLRAAAKSVAVSSPAPFQVRDAAGAAMTVSGTLALGPKLTPVIGGAATALVPPVSVAPAAGALLSVGGKPYRGTLEISSAGAALQVVDVVGLEAYLQGVVPGEVPGTWPAAALEAQAIAARSYALASRAKGQSWDLFPDPRSQQYLGASAETPETTAAVKATAGIALFYGGTVATTFYSSSSGGRTASGLEAFGLDVPYLPSQPDPWDTASPNHAWKPQALTGARIARALGLQAPVVDVQERFTASSRVASLVVTAQDGETLGITGAEARKRLGLRSTAFRIATLRFLTPATAASAGVPLRLSGVARDADGPSLERLGPDGAWAPVVRRLRVSAAGTFAAVVHPAQTTTYRLSASGLPGPTLTIPVVGAPT